MYIPASEFVNGRRLRTNIVPESPRVTEKRSEECVISLPRLSINRPLCGEEEAETQWKIGTELPRDEAMMKLLLGRASPVDCT